MEKVEPTQTELEEKATTTCGCWKETQLVGICDLLTTIAGQCKWHGWIHPDSHAEIQRFGFKLGGQSQSTLSESLNKNELRLSLEDNKNNCRWSSFALSSLSALAVVVQVKMNGKVEIRSRHWKIRFAYKSELLERQTQLKSNRESYSLHIGNNCNLSQISLIYNAIIKW